MDIQTGVSIILKRWLGVRRDDLILLITAVVTGLINISGYTDLIPYLAVDLYNDFYCRFNAFAFVIFRPFCN